MAFSLFFTYANADEDKAHFNKLAKFINPFVKSKSGELLHCENEDLLETHADNAHVIIVLLSSEFLCYHEHPKRQKLYDKISSSLCDPSKLVITVELEDCLWSFDEAFKGRQPHKLKKTDASNYGYMDIIQKILAEINDHKPSVSLKKTLQEGLYRLNYDKQRDVFNAHFKELSLLNILLIRGTPECGQHLLLRTFLKYKKIDFRDERKLVWLNAKYFESDQSDKWIWQQIAVTFGLFPQNMTLETIGQYLINRLRTEPIFIRFDDIHLVKKESIVVIRKIWEQLYQYISNRAVSLNHQIFVFVTDRSENDDDDYSEYQFSSAENKAICNRILCILPRIEFLNQAATETWLNILKHDPELEIISQYLAANHILSDASESLPIYQAVNKMIDKLGKVDPELENNRNDFLARI